MVSAEICWKYALGNTSDRIPPVSSISPGCDCDQLWEADYHILSINALCRLRSDRSRFSPIASEVTVAQPIMIIFCVALKIRSKHCCSRDSRGHSLISVSHLLLLWHYIRPPETAWKSSKFSFPLFIIFTMHSVVPTARDAGTLHFPLAFPNVSNTLPTLPYIPNE